MKNINLMKFNKYFLSFILTFIYTLRYNSQVTIGSDIAPNQGSLLQIKNIDNAINNETVDANGGGLLLPRVGLINLNTLEPFISITDNEWNVSQQSTTKKRHTGLMVYNFATINDLKKGLYVWNGKNWRLFNNNPSESYFYPPAFNLPLPEIDKPTDPLRTYDLYEVYENQFNKNNTVITNDYNEDSWITNPEYKLERIPFPTETQLYKRTDLDYVITYYDTNIIYDVSINDQGILSYRVKDNDPGILSFLNLMFVIKD